MVGLVGHEGQVLLGKGFPLRRGGRRPDPAVRADRICAEIVVEGDGRVPLAPRLRQGLGLRQVGAPALQDLGGNLVDVAFFVVDSRLPGFVDQGLFKVLATMAQPVGVTSSPRTSTG